MVRDGSVIMPVDTLAEAQPIARSWIARQAETSLRAGKVRKILRIDIVSIVEDRPPFKLRHQLAIRADDGQLAVLY